MAPFLIPIACVSHTPRLSPISQPSANHLRAPYQLPAFQLVLQISAHYTRLLQITADQDRFSGQILRKDRPDQNPWKTRED